jgi:Iron-containing redox enzyme
MMNRNDWREVFRFAIQPEVFLDAENIRVLLGPERTRAVSPAGQGPDEAKPFAVELESRLDALRAQASATEERWSAIFGSVGATELGPVVDRMIVMQSAPMASALGAWLQGLSTPSAFEDPAQLKILALLADDVGVGNAESSRHDAHRLLARRLEVTSVAGPVAHLPSVAELDEEMFAWPAVIFALSRRSDVFELELLGIDLALRSVGMLPAWRALARRVGPHDLSGLDLSVARTSALLELGSPLSLSREIAAGYARGPEQAARIWQGIDWAARGLAHLCDHMQAAVTAAIDPRIAMARMVRLRAREARIYHHDYKLEGKLLSTWFEEALTDPLPLVDALGRSKLVRPKAPGSSALLDALIRPDGPMFRIFSPEDLVTMRRWITSLAPARPAAVDPPSASPRPVAAGATGASITVGDLGMGAAPTSLREAYHLLQGRALAPQTRAFAHAYVQRWTELARASIDKTSRSLPARWTPGALRAWLLDAHDQHSDVFQQGGDELPTREAVIDQTLQLAPLTLIDGSWLQGFTETRLASSRTGWRLFQTYWDELGNGQWAINHPKIYRDVLISMGIELAPTGSLEFATDPRIREASFRLPVYWLCIGKCPVTFRPEVLGLNLAMELSGVGGSYRAAQKFMKHYRFPTIFVDLHNTIDNVSTGHSAWAADAIDEHMREVTEIGDPIAEWLRIRTGYESLAPITKKSRDLDYFRRSSSVRRQSRSPQAQLPTGP